MLLHPYFVQHHITNILQQLILRVDDFVDISFIAQHILQILRSFIVMKYSSPQLFDQVAELAIPILDKDWIAPIFSVGIFYTNTINTMDHLIHFYNNDFE